MDHKAIKIDKILTYDNLADLMTDDQLDEIGMECLEGYNEDEQSRSGWKDRMKLAIELAMQVTRKKNRPWKNAANVKFPLITIAANAYNSRIYPALVNGTQIVKMKVIGGDPTGEKSQRAYRIAAHMNYQLLEQDENWEVEMDRLTMSLAIMGCAFKKIFYDPEKGHNVSYNVLPNNLVVNYYATSLEDAERVTEVIPMAKREVITKQRLGHFRKVALDDPTPKVGPDDSKERQGLTPPGSGHVYDVLEQHCYMDLDDDGYPEPYVVTLNKFDGTVWRITPRFDEESIVPSVDNSREIAKIIPDRYYKKYIFLPSPDGGFYELGFGALLGPINESINTALNMLLDAGTLANMQGGFVGRGARVKKGNYRFTPGEYKEVNATGDDLRKSIVPMTFKEPSQTLLRLLQLLIEYGERASSVSDMMVGKTPGQNTPAQTSMNALEQGQKVFNGIYKRNYRDLRGELKMNYELNRKFLNPKEYFDVVDMTQEAPQQPQPQGQPGQMPQGMPPEMAGQMPQGMPPQEMQGVQQVEQGVVERTDYDGAVNDLMLVADPNVASAEQRVMKAQVVREAAMQAPGYNMYAVEKRFLEAHDIINIAELLPDPKGPKAIPPQPDLKLEALKLKSESDAQYKMQKLVGELAVMEVQVLEIETRAVKNLADAEAAEDGSQIGVLTHQLATIRERREGIQQMRENTRNDRNDKVQQQGRQAPGKP